MKKISILFAAMFAATSLFSGDILEIRPCDQFGYSKLTGGTTGSNKPYATLAAPLGSGEDLYFNVRLVAHDEIASASETSYGYYKLEHLSKTTSESNDLYMSPLSIGICIGENKRWAELVTIRRTPSEYTTSTSESVLPSKHLFDVVFHYRTQPGDQGLPIRLMLADGTPVPENYTSSGLVQPTMEYAFRNNERDGKWRIDYHSPDGLTVVPASFIFNPTPAVPTDDKPETDTLSANASLEQCGFFVQTIKFADSEQSLWEKPGEYWKSVGNNRTKTAEITFSAKIEKATTVYMWAVDSDWLAAAKEGTGTYNPAAIAVEMTGSDVSEQPITVGYDSTGVAKTANVNMFVKKIEGGQSDPIQFKFKGLLADKNATLILSSSPDFLWKTGVGYILKKDFVEIPVRSIKSEPELTLRDAKSKYVYDVTSDFSTPLTTLTLTLTDPYTAGDMTVTVTPKLTNAKLKEKYTWDQLVRVTKDEVSPGVVPAASTLTFTITAGDTLEKTLFLYGMGASADANHSDLKGNKIDFDITVEPEGARTFLADHIAFDTLYVNPESPAITVPSTEVLATKETKTPIKITVTDNYTDMQDRTTGYTVKWQWWKKNVASTVPTTREEQTLATKDGKYSRFAPNTKGILYAIDEGGNFIEEKDEYLPAIPSDAIPAGYENGYLWVVAPNKATSMPEEQTECLSVKVSVIELPKATGAYYTTLTGDTETEDPFPEIETTKGKATTAYVGVTLEQDYLGGKLYVFLAPTEADKLKYISGNCLTNSAKSSDIYFDSTSTSKSKRGKLTLKDGIEDNTSIAFKMFLCKSARFDETKVIDEYECTIGDLEIENVDPVIHDVDMNGSGVDEDDPGRISGAATVNVDQIFKLTVWDADADKEATDESKTGGNDNRFTITYKFADGDGDAGTQGYGKKKTYYGNPDDFVVTNSFSNTGIGKFSVVLTDKDGGETEQEFAFDITDRPYVMLTVANEATGIDEKTHDASFSVALSQAASKKIDVYLTVTETSGTGGELILDGTKVTNSNNTYKITFDKGKKDAQTLYITRADGSEDGSTFSLVAAVATKDEIPDMEGVTYDQYYTPGKIGQFKVANVNPTIKVDNKFTADGEDAVVTNTTPVAMGSAATIGIRASDVPADVTNITIYVADQGDPRQRSFTITNSSTVVTTNLTFTSPGYQSVTVTAKDKDNGMTTLTIWYNVESAKMLNFWAVGPGVGAGNELTARYNTAGRGEGRVYVKNKTCSDATRWNFEFNCGLDSYVNVWAQGYCMGEVDDGTLNRRGGMTDIPINPNGGIVIGTAEPRYYTYDDSEGKDSFFYCWIQTTTGDNSEKTSALIGVPNPLVDTNDFAQTQVTLPTDADDKTGAYMPTTVEAVFSKEKLASDNMGDIDGDGIPDIYVTTYRFDVYDTTGALTGDDTAANLAGYNEDGDYFPVLFTSNNGSFVPGTSNTWAAVAGRAFKARYEIRGIDDGALSAFNDAASKPFVKVTRAKSVVNYADPEKDTTSTLSSLEWDAYVQAGKPGTDKWSPERPTDPTKADTDGDDLPDGYEYYIWYKAYVGWFDDDGKHQYLTGRKYNHLDPTRPTLITPAEIYAIYDPLVPAEENFWAKQDTDNDGLTDWQEMQYYGTNPFDFDTDGDGLPDGYEIMLGDMTKFDPCNYNSNGDANNVSDANENYDGDTMAAFDLSVGMIGVLEDGEVTYYCLDKGTFTTSLEDAESGETLTRVGTVITVRSGDNTYRYATTEPVETYEDEDGKKHLKHDIKKNLWPVTVTEGAPIVVDLESNAPTTLDRGMEVLEILNDQEYRYRGVFLLSQVTFEPTSAKRIHKAWKYRDGQYALGDKDVGYGFMRKPVVYLNNATATVRVLHDNVLDLRTEELQRKKNLPCGFNPTTAWQRNGGGTDSSNYTNYDEFMLMFHFYHCGTITGNAITPTDKKTLQQIWTDYTTTPTNFDTDGDQIPDGWELYVGEGLGVKNANNANNPTEGTYFTLLQEYSGIESSTAYGWTPKDTTWSNKEWPTCPTCLDTDRDGLTDAQEGGQVTDTDSQYHYLSDVVGKYFSYNVPRYKSHSKKKGFICWAGGKLNPCSCDTDDDGLPDEWEAEFHGSYTANSADLVDQGTNTSELVVSDGARWNMDGMDGTVADARLDYDGDGLANWQEYITGAMRCWRYDDAVSPWESGYATVTNMPTPGTAEWNKYWHDLLLDASPENRLYNPHMANGVCDLGRYFTCCPFAWDPHGYNELLGIGRWYYFKDGANHELADLLNPNYQRAREEWPDGNYPYEIVLFSAPQKYISCDPRLIDSDHDGMDDYYELFHGMNPLLGAANVADATGAEGMPSDYNTPCDLVFDAYVHMAGKVSTATGGTAAYPACARNNFWTNTKYREAKIKNPELGGYDFMAYPWMNGMASADADGDGIVNIEEAIMPNVQAASTYHHTDPTPLWTTDSSYTNSLTRRFYRLGLASAQNEDGLEYTTSWLKSTGTHTFEWEGVTYDLLNYDGFSYANGTLSFNYNLDRWGTSDGWAFSFEENEGFDSDHDYLSDMEELQGKTKNASDPQVHDDPLRRQAMYFNGEDAFLQTPVRVAEMMPVVLDTPDQARQNFLYFTVECWVKPDASILGKQATYTMVERAIYADNAGPADEKLIRKNFQIALKNGRWYTCYDSTGTTTKKYEITDGPVATNAWTHIAATFDGEDFKLYVNGVNNNVVKTQAQPEHGVSALAVTPYNAMTTNGNGTVWHDRDYVTILVGASVKTKRGFIFDNAWRGRNYTLITPENPYGIDWESQTTFKDYQDYFKGYIDEVRIWDGARSQTDIQGDYDERTRYSFELAAENRLAVYTKWAAGCSRTPTSPEQLPALLMYHWAFDHIPGAVMTNDVVSVPAGFDTAASVTDASARWVRPSDFKSPHWDSVGVRSRVYGKTAWVPWLNNTAAHLPRLDRTTLDSVYWSDDYVGYSAVVSNATLASYNVSSISFPRKAEVPSVWHQQTYSVVEYYDSHLDDYYLYWDLAVKLPAVVGATQNTRWHAIAGYKTKDIPVTDEISRFSFTSRDRNVVGDDLLPMGGVYPRRISLAEGGMWDNKPGQSPSASDAWAQTGNDADNNGLPDWWEEYARANYCDDLDPKEPLEWDTTVTYRNGVKMPAYQAYLRDLSSGLVKIGSKIVRDPNYADTRDLNKNGIPDWWENENNLSTTEDQSFEDTDNDGLNNYNEYKLEQILGGFGIFQTKLAFTLDFQHDYFRTNGLAAPAKRYAGFVATDHDFVEDYYEDLQGLAVANRYVYDAHTDNDKNNWSLWSEGRAVYNSNTWVQVGTTTNMQVLSFNGYTQDAYLEWVDWRRKNIESGAVEVLWEHAYIKDSDGNEWDQGKANYEWFFPAMDWRCEYTVYTLEPLMMYGGRPLPNVTVTVWGDSEASSYLMPEVGEDGTTNYVAMTGSLTLKCYEGNDLTEPYQTFTLTDGETVNGRTVYTFSEADRLASYLREGLNTFVVENGDAIGFTQAYVGYDKVNIEVGLSAYEEVLPASTSFSYGGYTVIRRTAINGVACKVRPVWAGTVEEYGDVTAANILNGFLSGNGVFDLDSKYLVSDAAALGIDQQDIISATYEMVDETSAGYSSLLTSLTGDGTVKTFAYNRPTATIVAPTEGAEYTVRTRKPTVKFTGLDGMTACIVEITNVTDNTSFAVTNLLPVAGTDGVRVLELPFEIGTDLKDNAVYSWRVCGLNAKWPTADGWADWAKFKTAVKSIGGETGYGSLGVEVRYYGAATNDTGDVIVGVYADAAFATKPVATCRLAKGDFARLSVEKRSAEFWTAATNVFFDGIAPGDYYVMAFNDRNGNGTRDAWESWGYLNKVGSSASDLYTPQTLTVASTKGYIPTGIVFMEDTDVNDNQIPDCVEDETEVKVEGQGQDIDGDGLDDKDAYWNESLWFTDPLVWDTDGDGFPDGYEVWAGFDPLAIDQVAETKEYTYISSSSQASSNRTYTVQVNLADYAAEGDVMAYAMVTRKVLVVSNRTDQATLYVAVDADDLTNYQVGQNMPKRTFTTVGYYATLPADDWNDDTVADYYTFGMAAETTADDTLIKIIPSFDVMLMHWQVFDAFGFEPGVATPDDATLRADGKVHTRPFYGIDKYLIAMLYGSEGEERMNAQRRWGQKNTCLVPGVVDFDGDAIPDGWELYVSKGYATEGTFISPWVNRDGWKANGSYKLSVTGKDGRHKYLTDPEWTLAEMYNNGVNPANPYDDYTFHSDIDNKTARQFNIEDATAQSADDDNDGLSNIAEYRIYVNENDTNDVRKIRTDGVTIDYFRTNGVTGVGKRYWGEKYADHDFIEDAWEDLYGRAVKDGQAGANRNVYDALRDGDADGWDNFSEARAGTDPTYETKSSLSSVASEGDFATGEYPVPVIKATVSYNTKDLFDYPLVVQAWHGNDVEGIPDAIWGVAGSADESTTQTRFLGLNPNRKMTINLGPGAIGQGSVKLKPFDPYYELHTVNYETNGTVKSTSTQRHGFDDSKWADFAYFDRPFIPSGDDSDCVYLAGGGSVNYRTGAVTIEFGSETFQDEEKIWTITDTDQQWQYELWDLSRSYWRITWRNRIVETGNTKEIYLSIPNESTDSARSLGRVRQGVNTFVVFADKNSNGAWDDGEPFGIVRNVNVGWSGTEIKVDLTANAEYYNRVKLTDTTSVTYNIVDGVTNVVASSQQIADGKQRALIIRRAVNGEETSRPYVAAAKRIDFTYRDWIGEIDYATEGAWDLDWAHLAADMAKEGIALDTVKSATYDVYLGYGSTTPVATFTRSFDLTRLAPKPTTATEDDGYLQHAAKPTLGWTFDPGYTAFAIEIAKDRDFTDIVYSETNFMPVAVNGAAVYSPDCCVGEKLADGTVYYWHVAELNAKFTTNVWSKAVSFKTAVATGGDTGYGKLTAEVRYYGPAVEACSNVIVGVYASPDFTGMPVARQALGGERKLETLEKPATVTFGGIQPGAYYVMAFVDKNKNGIRDAYETWGYANNVGTGLADLYTPVETVVSKSGTATPVAAIYLEDTDVNQNGTPDAAEDMTNWKPATTTVDSDGDGIGDEDEVAIGTDPNNADTDGDGLNDGLEESYCTNPLAADTDGDGMDDGWEVASGLDPLVNDADAAWPGDLMAFKEFSAKVLVATNGVTNVAYVVREQANEATEQVTNNLLYTTFKVGEALYVGRVLTDAEKIAATNTYAYAYVSTNVVAMHSAVYDFYGYDATTARAAGGTNTVAFTAYYKYLTQKYYLAEFDGGAATNDFALAYGKLDSNANYIPDGWELYVRYAANKDVTSLREELEGAFEYNYDPWSTIDGIPNLWKLWGNIDPSDKGIVTNAFVEGDVMAYAEEDATLVWVLEGGETNAYFVADGSTVVRRGDKIPLNALVSAYRYPVVVGEGTNAVIVLKYGIGTNLVSTAKVRVVREPEATTAVLVHAQVYDKFGFDPTTATTNAAAANTKEFTALDKYLVVRYLEAIGLADEATVNKNRQWSDYTLKPYNLDYDGDGIADGWELYVMFGPDGAGSETLANAKISPWKPCDARVASPDSAKTANEILLIDEYDGGNSPTDPWNVDTDGDGVSDYYASKYHLKGGDSGADYDGDGLSNYAEYLISEVFKFAALDPDNAKTDGSCVDYFRKYGDLYFGEIFTDHDQVSDVWEQKYAHHVGSSSDLYANRDIYDPSADRDSDGWSNYAEAQAGTSPENITAPGIDGEILKEYPVPAIRAKVAYRGKSVLSAPLIFQAWSEKTDPGMTSTPDAAWRAASDESVTNVTKYIGVNPGTVRSYYLGTGAVSPGSVRIDFRDMAFERATVFNGEEVAGKTVSGEVGDSKWFYFVQDRDGVLYTSATNLTAATPVKVGTIDYATGYMTVDFGCEALQGVAYDFSINGSTATTTESKDTAVYSNCDKLNLSRSYVKIAWQPVKTDTTGNATYYLSDCTAAVANKGHVREGKNKFVVFSDTSGNGAYTPGEPFGFVGGVEVGWQGGAFEVELTETSPIFARVDLTSASDPTTDRVAFQAGNSAVIDVEDAQKLFKSDTKLRIYGEDTGYGDDATGSESSTSGSSESRYVRVRVVRALVDGSDVLGKDSDGHNVYVDRAVVMDKKLDLSVRGYIHEGDFLSTNSFDVGWSDLEENVYGRDDDVGYFIDATNITYMIVMGEGSYTAGGSNTVFRSLISRTYDSVAARQGGFVKPVIDTAQPGYVYGAKPTFRWAMQDKNGVSHNSYTAFKFQIMSSSTVVYDSGYRCAPARGSDGWYEWTLADPLGGVIVPGKEYTWRVAMFNAKFRDDTFWNDKYNDWAVYTGKSYTVTTWSDSAAFVVDMNQQQAMNDHGYSSIAAAVKYAGPECVLTKGKVIVQAFETADFAGDPMGESFVTDDDEIVDTAHIVENVRVLGLPANGTYYLRAFIDSNCNGVKDDWESWGAADKSVTISDKTVAVPTVGIYIEDADTDRDWIPDAYEYVKKGNLTALGPEVIDGDKIRFIGTIATSVGTAGISTGLTGASLTIFQNQSFVKLAMDDLGTTVSIDDIRKAVEKKVNPDTVKITALTLAPDGSKVTLALSAEVTDSIAGELLGKVYDISNLTKQTVTVTVRVYKKNTLAEAGWTLVSTQSKTFGRDAQQIDVPVTGVNMTSGFYKVEVVQ